MKETKHHGAVIGATVLLIHNRGEPEQVPHKSVVNVGCMSITCPTIHITNTESPTLGG